MCAGSNLDIEISFKILCNDTQHISGNVENFMTQAADNIYLQYLCHIDKFKSTGS